MHYVVEFQEPGQTGGASALPAGTANPRCNPPVDFLLGDIRNARTLAIHRSDETCPGRPQLESFIADVYFAVHQASLNAFMPQLFAIQDDSQQPVAAIGMRPIDDRPIFLEQYLDTVVEECVSEVAGTAVARSEIAEVGNLASMSLGGGRLLIAFMVHHLAASGIRYAVCTGTNAVRAALKRMGVDFTLVQEAQPERLGEEQVHWGNYYQHNPFVLVVDIQSATRLLQPSYSYQQQAL